MSQRRLYRYSSEVSGIIPIQSFYAGDLGISMKLAGDIHGLGVVVGNAIDQQQERVDARLVRRLIHRAVSYTHLDVYKRQALRHLSVQRH